MEDSILLAALDLQKELRNDKRIIKLNELEDLLNNNDEAKILSYQMDLASTRYSDALKIYSNNSQEIKPYRKALKDAKEKLNSLPLVIEYNKAYQEVKSLLDSINEIVFNKYREALNLNKKK